MKICFVGDTGTGYHRLSGWFYEKDIDITYTCDKDIDIIIFVFSLSRVGTFHHLPKLWKKYAHSCDTHIVVGNKLDLPRLVSYHEGDEWATKQEAYYAECSALTGENVADLINLCLYDSDSD